MLQYPSKVSSSNAPAPQPAAASAAVWYPVPQSVAPASRSNRPLNLRSRRNPPPYLSKCGIQLNFPSRNNHASMPLPQKQPTTMPQQEWHPAQIPQQQKQPVPIPQQLKFPRSNRPLNLRSSRRNPPQYLSKCGIQLNFRIQLKFSAESNRPPCLYHIPQKQPTTMPQQEWHPAQKNRPQQQKKQPSQYPSNSKSRYENGKTVFSQTRYTPGEVMPVDSGNSLKDNHVDIAAPSIYPPLVKDPARKI
ncbi:hypothetical protein J4Q44_G00287240 [Coregonus suidteri]|uniref:Uncharacterized protein n=1 Tax=Coregonus suidteri TaxID=861788 RepID=A0AAN8L6J2_9TELE